MERFWWKKNETTQVGDVYKTLTFSVPQLLKRHPKCLQDNITIKLFTARKQTLQINQTMNQSMKKYADKFSHCFNCLIDSFVSMKLIPTVKASSENYEETTMDKLLRSKAPEDFVGVDYVQEYIDNETGMDRVKLLFSKTHGNLYHPSLQIIMTDTRNTMFGIFMATFVIGGIHAKRKFIEKNKAAKYETRMQAVKASTDRMVIGGIKFGLTMSLKTGIFIGTFLLLSQVISSFRNKSSPLHYMIAGSVACPLWRINMGLKAMLATSVIGAVVGLGGGVLFCALLRAADRTEDKMHYFFITEMLENQRAIDRLKSQANEEIEKI